MPVRVEITTKRGRTAIVEFERMPTEQDIDEAAAAIDAQYDAQQATQQQPAQQQPQRRGVLDRLAGWFMNTRLGKWLAASPTPIAPGGPVARQVAPAQPAQPAAPTDAIAEAQRLVQQGVPPREASKRLAERLQAQPEALATLKQFGRAIVKPETLVDDSAKPPSTLEALINIFGAPFFALTASSIERIPEAERPERFKGRDWASLYAEKGGAGTWLEAEKPEWPAWLRSALGIGIDQLAAWLLGGGIGKGMKLVGEGVQAAAKTPAGSQLADILKVAKFRVLEPTISKAMGELDAGKVRQLEDILKRVRQPGVQYSEDYIVRQIAVAASQMTEAERDALARIVTQQFRGPVPPRITTAIRKPFDVLRRDQGLPARTAQLLKQAKRSSPEQAAGEIQREALSSLQGALQQLKDELARAGRPDLAEPIRIPTTAQEASPQLTEAGWKLPDYVDRLLMMQFESLPKQAMRALSNAIYRAGQYAATEVATTLIARRELAPGLLADFIRQQAELAQAPSRLARLYGAWRFGKTAANLPTWVRNFVQNFVLHYLSGRLRPSGQEPLPVGLAYRLAARLQDEMGSARLSAAGLPELLRTAGQEPTRLQRLAEAIGKGYSRGDALAAALMQRMTGQPVEEFLSTYERLPEALDILKRFGLRPFINWEYYAGKELLRGMKEVPGRWGQLLNLPIHADINEQGVLLYRRKDPLTGQDVEVRVPLRVLLPFDIDLQLDRFPVLDIPSRLRAALAGEGTSPRRFTTTIAPPEGEVTPEQMEAQLRRATALDTLKQLLIEMAPSMALYGADVAGLSKRTSPRYPERTPAELLLALIGLSNQPSLRTLQEAKDELEQAEIARRWQRRVRMGALRQQK